MKKIKNLKLTNGTCHINGMECLVTECSHSYARCLTKLLWGLLSPDLRGQAIKELEVFMASKDLYICSRAQKNCSCGCQHAVPHEPSVIHYENDGVYCNERPDYCLTVCHRVECKPYRFETK